MVVESLRATGVTIILTTHYIEEAEAIADRVGVINNGEMIVVNNTAELIKSMGKKKLTIDFHEKINSIPSSLDKYNLELNNEGLSVSYSYDTQSTQTGITSLLQDVKETGLRLKDIKTEHSSLEIIFVELVQKDEK